jgi:hypothetical protein
VTLTVEAANRPSLRTRWIFTQILKATSNFPGSIAPGEKARRRAAGKVAKQSGKVNRNK